MSLNDQNCPSTIKSQLLCQLSYRGNQLRIKHRNGPSLVRLKAIGSSLMFRVPPRGSTGGYYGRVQVSGKIRKAPD
jgi:hypothetical protein